MSNELREWVTRALETSLKLWEADSRLWPAADQVLKPLIVELRALEPSPEREGQLPEWEELSPAAQVKIIDALLPTVDADGCYEPWHVYEAIRTAHPPTPRATEQAWIPVGKRLPEADGRFEVVKTNHAKEWVVSTREFRDGKFISEATISHWRESTLPPSPKEKE